MDQEKTGKENFLTIFQPKNRGGITLPPEVEKLPALVTEVGISSFLAWPADIAEFSKTTRSPEQENRLRKLKKRKEIGENFHSLLDSAPGHLIDLICKSFIGMIKDSRKKTEFLFSFIHQYMGKKGAHGNRRYLLSKKVKGYLERAIEKYYIEKNDEYLEMDEKSKIGVWNLEWLCIHTILKVEGIRKPFRKIVNDVGISGHFSNEEMWTEKIPLNTFELMIIIKMLDVEHYVHVEKNGNMSSQEVYKLLRKVLSFVAAADQTAADKGYRFAQLGRGAFVDEVSMVRARLIKLERVYERTGTFPPRQKSFILAQIGRMEEMIANFHDPDVIALIKTEVGILEISWTDDRKIETRVLEISLEKNMNHLLTFTQEEKSNEGEVGEIFWDFSWLDDINPQRINISPTKSPMVLALFNYQIVQQIVDFVAEINPFIIDFIKEHPNLSSRESEEVYNDMRMKEEFFVKSPKETKMMAIVRYLHGYRAVISHHRVQGSIKKIHNKVFGKMFDVFSFIESIV